MRNAILVVSSVALFLLAAKAHGRELRIEREVAGVSRVVFGGENPPFVEALWRAERVRFWIATPVLAAALAAILIARGSPRLHVAMAVTSWAPSMAFAALGVLSVVRAGGLGRGGLSGSAAWWSLVAVAAAAAIASHAPPVDGG